MGFDAVVNDIYLNSSFSYLSLVYREAIVFGMLTLYLETLL